MRPSSLPSELHYELAGAGGSPPLLMGGSLGTTLAMWDPQLPALAEGRRVIRFDHRGHGGSPVPEGPYAIDQLGGDVLALLDRLEIPTAAYCGLSIGGMVGIWLAANAPGRIERLVLICTSSHLGPTAGYAERAAIVRDAGSAAVVADAVLGRWFTPDYAERHPEVVARHRAMIAATAPEGYAGCCEAISAMDLRPDLQQIEAPTLVIAAADDPSTPPAHGRLIADAVASARLHVIDEAAHLASVQQAEQVTRLIRTHLDSARA